MSRSRWRAFKGKQHDSRFEQVWFWFEGTRNAMIEWLGPIRPIEGCTPHLIRHFSIHASPVRVGCSTLEGLGKPRQGKPCLLRAGSTIMALL